ncbi:uncharacterized protein BDV17DRAFT_134973 [Aspergillus undulatus]|uniref:uncharacterized protein n=1 Tax=Aspergillus undulatus TaxID=1810928 RepID=UPI003CCD249A
MYREPSSTEASKHSTVKDPCAAARSAIRRQTTIRRPSRYGGSAWRSATLRSPFPRPLVDELEREANGPTRHSYSPVPPPAPPSDPLHPNGGFEAWGRSEAGRRMVSNVLRRSRQMATERNSTLADLDPRTSSTADAHARAESQDHLPFTPRFAPAIAYHGYSTPLAGPDGSIRLPPAYGEDTASLIPLLRRVGSMHDANLTSRGPPIDGLGDRQRSVDLDDDHANDAWETLLTTMAPDTNLPSADSSFTSASASGTNDSRNGTSRSSATSLDPLQNSLHTTIPTVHMTLDPYQEYPNPCDYSSTSGSDTESDGEITQQSLYRRYRRRMRQVESMRRAQNLQSAMNNPPSIPTISFAFSDSSQDNELQDMQAILGRFARREDIPDDWWAAAGLTRTIGQRAGASDVSTTTPGPDGPVRPR